MLESLRENDERRQNIYRASESCVRRPNVPLEPPRRSLVRHSFGSSWPGLGRSPSTPLYFEHNSPKRIPATAEVPGQYTPERISIDLAESYSIPPPLNYTLRDKKWRIAIFWCFIVFDCAIMPIGLYFILWYEAGPGSGEKDALSANTVLSIVTAAIGGSSILEYFLRAWRLWKQGSDCRVIAAQSRWCFDWFHWWFGVCLLVVVAELVLGTAWNEPNIRLLSLPLASVQAVFGTVLLLTDLLHFFAVPAPVRISSVPRGAKVRPGIYPVIEDICAVDGAGTTEFRRSLERRYKASPIFRTMLRHLGLFWALGALASAAGTMFLVFDLDDTDVAYTIGWTVPFVWAGIWLLITIRYVQHMLRKELRQWVGEVILLNAVA